MKITTKRLKQIIAEEMQNLNLSEMDDTSADAAMSFDKKAIMDLASYFTNEGMALRESVVNAVESMVLQDPAAQALARDIQPPREQSILEALMMSLTKGIELRKN